MRSARLLAALSIAVAVAVGATAEPAQAKGPKQVTLSGPGIGTPVAVLASEGDGPAKNGSEFPDHLGYALTQLLGPYLHGSADAQPLGDYAARHLGDRYFLTWEMWVPPGAYAADYTYVLEIYPWAPRPMVHISPDRPGEVDQWVQLPVLIREILVAYGATAPPAYAAQFALTTTQAPPPERNDSESAGVWLPGTVAGVLVAFTAGLVLGRRRRVSIH